MLIGSIQQLLLIMEFQPYYRPVHPCVKYEPVISAAVTVIGVQNSETE